MGYLPVRTLQSCKALMFLALAGLEAKANRDSCMARPTAQSWWPGQNRQILAHVHRGRSPWTKQPLNSSLETQETSFESSYCSQAKRAVSSSRRRLRSILIRGRGAAAGKLVPPGSLPTWPASHCPWRRPLYDALPSAERQAQAHRLVEHGNSALVVDVCCIFDGIPVSHRQFCKPSRYVT